MHLSPYSSQHCVLSCVSILEQSLPVSKCPHVCVLSSVLGVAQGVMHAAVVHDVNAVVLDGFQVQLLAVSIHTPKHRIIQHPLCAVLLVSCRVL